MKTGAWGYGSGKTFHSDKLLYSASPRLSIASHSFHAALNRSVFQPEGRHFYCKCRVVGETDTDGFPFRRSTSKFLTERCRANPQPLSSTGQQGIGNKVSKAHLYAIFTKGGKGSSSKSSRGDEDGEEKRENPLGSGGLAPWQTPLDPMLEEIEREKEQHEEIPYVPEVDENADLNSELLKEIASKGATEIRVDRVDKTFFSRSVGAKTVIHNVSLTVEPGSMVALVGPSGSGKTTLLRMIAGLEPMTSGRILFDGEDMAEVAVQDRDVGFMFQSYALFKHMTVADNIAFGLRTRKRRGSISEETVKKRVADLLDLVQLTELENRYPPQLSGGQRQRVALARALAQQPRVLLLDEPFGALDVLVRTELRSWVRRLQRALRITTIFVTHDQEEALEMADVMVVFRRGRIIQEGHPFEVYHQPNGPFVMNFMTDPNILRSNCMAVRRSGLRTSKPYVMLRATDAEIFWEERLELPTTPATVTYVNNMGAAVEVEVKYDDGEPMSWCMQRYDWEEMPMEVGMRVHLQLKPLLLMPFSPDQLMA
eukprot:TRINITY_DN3669_c0_g1_i1.p1 TRINITY_DN3669_c0_g1~~TRINITY_DN3669_c0_g1_i1.p1  ORF type:complete len:540 (-),score=127.79 TRINITY_DN3669_c0_g1_i1:177-1796(-)